MRFRNLILGLGLAMMPALAGAQQGDPGARIEAAMAAAGEARIPVELLESKVREGRAKNVPEARIAAAVEHRLQALLRARTALQQANASAISAGDLAVAADALQAGVSQRAMIEVMTGAPAQRRAVATAVLTELVELGVGSDIALARVQAAIAQGGEALVNLPAQASERARGNGRNRGSAGPPTDVDAGVRAGVDLRGRGRN